MFATSGTLLIFLGIYGFVALRFSSGLIVTLLLLGIILIVAQCLKAFGVRWKLPRNERSSSGAAKPVAANPRGDTGHGHRADNLAPARDRGISGLAL